MRAFSLSSCIFAYFSFSISLSVGPAWISSSTLSDFFLFSSSSLYFLDWTYLVISIKHSESSCFNWSNSLSLSLSLYGDFILLYSYFLVPSFCLLDFWVPLFDILLEEDFFFKPVGWTDSSSLLLEDSTTLWLFLWDFILIFGVIFKLFFWCYCVWCFFGDFSAYSIVL